MSTFTDTKIKGSSSPRLIPDERMDDKRGVAFAVPTPSPGVKQEVVEWEPRQANNEGEARAFRGSIEEPLTPETKVKLEAAPEGNEGKRERDGGGVSDADGSTMKRYKFNDPQMQARHDAELRARGSLHDKPPGSVRPRRLRAIDNDPKSRRRA
ncbi:hypothetical protein N3K66_008025 [Trichothecium roseum]|uniref:Uncharacterized protein n=1 Tax=Trichothecium roseum TaxID=47278 RepID=A0ACC0USA9_9HYPO|nr:hypothetical protein N3K66_008025 [Trichothecium roseum]